MKKGCIFLQTIKLFQGHGEQYFLCLEPWNNRHTHTSVTKISQIFQNSVKTGEIGPARIPKPLNLLFTVSKFQKKIKVSKKYVKKLDQILRLLVKKIL
jgi:hypothetical protein